MPGRLTQTFDPDGSKIWLPSQITNGHGHNNECSPLDDLSVKYIPSHPDYVRLVLLPHDDQDQLHLPQIIFFSFNTSLLAQVAQSVKMVATA